MYWVYVLKNTKGLLYKGSTPDLKRRLHEHLSGKFDSYTRRNGPWHLVHGEIFVTKIEAIKREKYLKTGKGREELSRILNSTSQTDPDNRCQPAE